MQRGRPIYIEGLPVFEAPLACSVPGCAGASWVFSEPGGISEESKSAVTQALGHHFRLHPGRSWVCPWYWRDDHKQHGRGFGDTLRISGVWRHAYQWKHWFNGGLIYHGSHDLFGSGSAPAFSVCLTPTSGWSVHT